MLLKILSELNNSKYYIDFYKLYFRILNIIFLPGHFFNQKIITNLLGSTFMLIQFHPVLILKIVGLQIKNIKVSQVIHLLLQALRQEITIMMVYRIYIQLDSRTEENFFRILVGSNSKMLQKKLVLTQLLFGAQVFLLLILITMAGQIFMFAHSIALTNCI